MPDDNVCCCQVKKNGHYHCLLQNWKKMGSLFCKGNKGTIEKAIPEVQLFGMLVAPEVCK